MLLTEEQFREIREIVADHHSAFVANAISPEAIAPEILERLKRKGLVDPKVESVREAYLYGHVLAAMDDPKVASMSYEELKRWLKVNPIPLTEIERQAIMVAQQQAGQYAVGLGNRVDQQTGQLMIEADHVLRQQLRGEIQSATAENIERRESVKQLKSDLGWATRDWSRDWDRIAVTEKQNAMQHGLADNIAARHGTDAWVAKRPMPDACEHCKRLHLGPDGQPRIFRLSTLVGNGTNFRLKTGEWKPGVGPVHPNCQCQLIHVPNGFGFDDQGRMVPGGTLGIKTDDLEASLRFEDELRKAEQLHGTIEFQGLTIRVENPAGSTRKWRDQQGREGKTTMLYPYGFIEGTEGQDGEEVDVFVGHAPTAKTVWIVHQQNPRSGLYDETKCFVGFQGDKARVEAIYRKHYDGPDFKCWIDELEIEAFKRWLGGFVKSEPPRQKFVLTKGYDVSTAARGPVGGTASNFLVETLPRERPESDPGLLSPDDVRAMYFRDEDRHVPDSLKRDLEVYTYNEFPERIVRRFDLPEDWGVQFEKIRAGADKNKADVMREYQRVRPATRNTIDPEDSFQKSVDGKMPSRHSSGIQRGAIMTLPIEKFEKGGPFIGPKGGKWADAAHTIHWEEPETKARAHEHEGYEPPKERYTDEEAFQRLMSLGDGLASSQEIGVEDATGFSNADVGAWGKVSARANAKDPASMYRVRSILAKYKRQISGKSKDGLDLYYKLGLYDASVARSEHKGPVIVPHYREDGTLLLPLAGYVGDHFGEYRSINKRFGVRARPVGGGWENYIRAGDKFDADGYRTALAEIGVLLHPLPEAPVVAPPPDAPTTGASVQAKGEGTKRTTDDVINSIIAKDIDDTVAVKVLTEGPDKGKLGIWSTYNLDFNAITKNNSTDPRALSGIVEARPDLGWARLIDTPRLAEEALAKLQAAMPNHTFVIDANVDVWKAEHEANTSEKQRPVPEVQAKLNPEIKPFPFQNEAVRFFQANGGNGLLGDEMGLGKTLEALAYAAAEGKRTIVVCPKVVRKNWLLEAKRFFPGHFDDVKELTTKDLKREGMPDLSKTKIATINYEILEKFMPAIEAGKFDLLIVDESHRMKNPKAQLTKNVQRIGKGIASKILLSGTALKNRREELYTQLQMVRPGFVTLGELTGGTIGGLHHKLSQVYLARKKKDVIKDMPPKLKQAVELEVPNLPKSGRGMSEDDLAGYSLEEREDIREALREGGGGGGGDLGEVTRIKHDTAKAKAPVTADFVKELLESSDSNVLVFTDSVPAAEAIAAKLGSLAALHTGKQSTEAQDAARAHFDPLRRKEGDPVRVLVSTTAKGIGFNAQTADKVVFNDLPWTPADKHQAEDRAYRIGTKGTVNVYDIHAAGSAFDTATAELLLTKDILYRKLLDGEKLTSEETKWAKEKISASDILAKMKGQQVGPKVTITEATKNATGATVIAPKPDPIEPPKVETKPTPVPTAPANDLPQHFIEQKPPAKGMVDWIEGHHGKARVETWPDGLKTKNLTFRFPFGQGDTPTFRRQLKAVGFKEVGGMGSAYVFSRDRDDIRQGITITSSGRTMTIDYQWEDQSGLKPEPPGGGQLTLFKSMDYQLASDYGAALEFCDGLVEDGHFDDAIDLIKSATHKYTRRIPSSDPPPKYRYVYGVTSKHHDADVKQGEKILIHHEGKRGHYEVQGVHADGTVTAKHDETGHVLVVKREHLHEMFADQHKEAIDAAHQRLTGTVKAAVKYGNDRQQAKAREALRAHEDRYQIKTPERIATQKAQDASLKAKATPTKENHREAAQLHLAAAKHESGTQQLHRDLAKLHGEAADLRAKEPEPKEKAPKKAEPKGAFFGTKRRAYLNLVDDDARNNFYEADKRYWAWTEGRGEKPPPYQGGELDAINEHLGLKRERKGFKVLDRRVTSLAEAWDKLVGQAKRWDSDKTLEAVEVMRQVPGLERIQLPDEVEAAITAKMAADSDQQYADSLEAGEGRIDDKLIDMSEKDESFDPNATDLDVSFDFGANVSDIPERG